MLAYNEIRPRKYILLNDEPYEVLSSNVFRKQQRKPVNQTKLRSVLSGKVTEHSFHQSDKVEEAHLENKKLKFLYQKKNEFWFSAPENPSDREFIDENIIGKNSLFIKENDVIEVLIFDGEIVGVSTPIKVHLKVAQAPPNIKGNTAQGGAKNVTLETGAVVSAPLFIEEGDTLEVNTQTGEYVTRIEKA